jgi:hypothetical protein
MVLPLIAAVFYAASMFYLHMLKGKVSTWMAI